MLSFALTLRTGESRVFATILARSIRKQGYSDGDREMYKGLLSIVLVTFLAPWALAEEKPNVVVMMVDNLG